jgi:hypothetical protein
VSSPCLFPRNCISSASSYYRVGRQVKSATPVSATPHATSVHMVRTRAKGRATYRRCSTIRPVHRTNRVQERTCTEAAWKRNHVWEITAQDIFILAYSHRIFASKYVPMGDGRCQRAWRVLPGVIRALLVTEVTEQQSDVECEGEGFGSRPSRYLPCYPQSPWALPRAQPAFPRHGRSARPAQDTRSTQGPTSRMSLSST